MKKKTSSHRSRRVAIANPSHRSEVTPRAYRRNPDVKGAAMMVGALAGGGAAVVALSYAVGMASWSPKMKAAAVAGAGVGMGLAMSKLGAPGVGTATAAASVGVASLSLANEYQLDRQTAALASRLGIGSPTTPAALPAPAATAPSAGLYGARSYAGR